MPLRLRLHAALPVAWWLAAATLCQGQSQRLGSFLAFGDWGWDPEKHGTIHSRQCQLAVAARMHEEAMKLGDLKFVINVGDSFYWRGCEGKQDPGWDSKWRNVYSKELRSVPWYSVYGNHDYGLVDECGCTDDTTRCSLVSPLPHNPDYFYMPDVSFFVEWPELGLEIIALDLTYYAWGKKTCKYTTCKKECLRILKDRADRGLAMYYQRRQVTEAKNVIVFSHYPTDYLFNVRPFYMSLRDNSLHNVEYFGGHRHSTDKNTSWRILPNSNWVVGGGGGWSCDTPFQGFVVGEIMADGRILTREVVLPPEVCCRESWLWRHWMKENLV